MIDIEYLDDPHNLKHFYITLKLINESHEIHVK